MATSLVGDPAAAAAGHAHRDALHHPAGVPMRLTPSPMRIARLTHCQADHHVNLEDNRSQEIDNPLAHLSPSQVRAAARDFALRHFPEDDLTGLFVRAALVARDPHSFRSLPDLTERESNTLARETRTSFWGQPKGLRVTTITLCIAAIIQGWNQTGSNGANLNWPTEFGIADRKGQLNDTRATWIFAGVNAVTYLAASLVGCWLSDPLNEFVYGRRGAIFLSGVFCFASVIGGACTHTWQQLFACRFLLGVGMGAKASVTPIMGAEVSPAHLRGSLVMNWQLFDAFGIFLGFSSNLVVSRIGPLGWRFQTAAAFLPAIPLLALIFVCPESPRFLLKKGRYRGAYRSLLQLREIPLQAARDLFYMNCQLQAEARLISNRDPELNGTGVNAVGSGVVGSRRPPADPPNVPDTPLWKSITSSFLKFFKDLRIRGDEQDFDTFQREVQRISYLTRFKQLFVKRRIRRATVAACVVMISQQLCGVNVLAFYSSTFLRDFNTTLTDQDAEKESRRALWLSWGLGLANFLFTFPTYLFIDKRGRRFLLLFGFPCMAISMLAAALAFNITGPTRNGAIAFFIFVFFFFYSWSGGPVPFAYSSEVFPLLNREAGMSFAVFCNLFGAGILTLFVPLLTKGLGHNHVSGPTGQSRTLGLFAGLNILALILIFFLVPETAGATLGTEEGNLNYISLEELNYIFGVRTRKHIEYQVKKVVPWAWGYYVRRRPEDRQRSTPELLYTWVRSQKEQAPQSQSSQSQSPQPQSPRPQPQPQFHQPQFHQPQHPGARGSLDISSH